MPQIGLKLWAPNVGGYLQEAKRLHREGCFDYVELYSSPGSRQFIASWSGVEIPFAIHCAHSLHGFNLSDAGSLHTNRELFGDAVAFFQALNARWIIVHPGILGETEQTIVQLNLLLREFNMQPDQVLVENKPFINLNDQPCVGATPESMRRITAACGTGMVLDVGHAIKYAIGAGRDWQPVLREFMKQRPQMLHVSDALMTHPKDEHMHFGDGQFDFDAIFGICNAPYISIETVKNDPEKLDDFERDVRFLRARTGAVKQL